jgi:stage II sporulation protein D
MRRRAYRYWTILICAGLIAGLAVVAIGLTAKPAPKSTKSNSSGTAASVRQTHEQAPRKPDEQPLVVPVYLSGEKRVDRVTLDEYVRGVLAAEMPVDFRLEALKAQALAARTYLIRRVADQDYGDMPVPDAWVTDTVAHQAYLTDAQLRSKWGSNYKGNVAKLDRAVRETKDLILTYHGKPINAMFFSTSNGWTENSEDYWGFALPYLRSVPSPWDRSLSAKYRETTTLSYKDFAGKLGLNTQSSGGRLAAGATVLDLSPGHRVQQIRIGGRLFSGRQVREKLGLPSSQFTWTVKGRKVEVTTTGYGHGVGMSQWGAEGMAREGKKAEDIVKYYYTGIEISNLKKYHLTYKT